MLIALILSAVIVVLIYQAVLLIDKQWQSYSIMQSKMTSILSLRNALNIDADKGIHIKYDFFEKKLSFYGNENSVEYILGSNVVRKCGSSNLIFEVEIKSVNVDHVIINDTASIIKNISLILDSTNSNMIFLEKYYSTEELILSN
jgi:hypothetical protein